MCVTALSNAYRPTVSGVVTSMVIFRRGPVESGHQVHISAPEHDGFKEKDLQHEHTNEK